MTDKSLAITAVSEKRALRKRMRALRDAVSAQQRADWSALICRHVVELPAYQSARVIHCFLPIQSEVDTRPIMEHALAHGKRVAIPLFIKGSGETLSCEIDSLATDDFEVGTFGLAMPRQRRLIDLQEIDIVLIPLLAFAVHPSSWPPVSSGDGTKVDEHADEVKFRRLGYGVGYYDRLLARVHVPRVGVAFELQRVAALPFEPHDQLLDSVITESASS